MTPCISSDLFRMYNSILKVESVKWKDGSAQFKSTTALMCMHSDKQPDIDMLRLGMLIYCNRLREQSDKRTWCMDGQHDTPLVSSLWVPGIVCIFSSLVYSWIPCRRGVLLIHRHALDEGLASFRHWQTAAVSQQPSSPFCAAVSTTAWLCGTPSARVGSSSHLKYLCVSGPVVDRVSV